MAGRKPPKAGPRVRTAVKAPVPTGNSLAALCAAAKDCRNYERWKDATQTVFGEGPARARVLVVGGQPGNEDVRGRPFVGPAGKLFDKALAELGLDRSAMYVTNAEAFSLRDAR